MRSGGSKMEMEWRERKKGIYASFENKELAI